MICAIYKIMGCQKNRSWMFGEINLEVDLSLRKYYLQQLFCITITERCGVLDNHFKLSISKLLEWDVRLFNNWPFIDPCDTNQPYTELVYLYYSMFGSIFFSYCVEKLENSYWNWNETDMR